MSRSGTWGVDFRFMPFASALQRKRPLSSSYGLRPTAYDLRFLTDLLHELHPVLQDLRHDRRGDRAAVIGALRLVEDHRDADPRLLGRREGDERADVPALRVAAGRGIDLLRRARLARHV